MNDTLLLSYERKENTFMHFRIDDSLTISFKFVFQHVEEHHTIVTIYLYENGSVRHAMEHEFYLPAPKQACMGYMGCWVRDYLWTKFMPNESGFGDHPYVHGFLFPYKDDERKKRRARVYLRSKSIGQIVVGTIYREWMMNHSISVDDMNDIGKISFRVSPKQIRSNQWMAEELVRHKLTMEPHVWAIFKSDLLKYNVSFCKWILWKTHSIRGKVSLDTYSSLLKETPNIIKKCKYGFDWRNDEETSLHQLHAPATRFQFFALRATLVKRGTAWGISEEGMKILGKFNRALPTADISVWHFFKKHRRIDKPYSFSRIHQMIVFVQDGIRLYEQYKDNTYGIPFVRVEGSPMRMLRNSVFNHRHEQEVTKKKQLSGPNYLLPRPKVSLPAWIEDARIKTAHEMISAGIDCRHCIGSYTLSDDVFIRIGNVCVQIFKNSLTIGQCYDSHDTITADSKKVKEKLDKALQPLRKELVNAQ